MHSAGMNLRENFDLSVYFILDPSLCGGRDIVDVALAAAGGGVTMVQLRNKVDDASIVAKARSIIGDDKILGLTAFTRAHYDAIDVGVVDYVGTGPVFPTLTDKGKPVLGVQGFADLIVHAPVSVVGIGGITPDSAPDIIGAGGQGVAMMRAVSGAEDVELAARAFVREV